MFGINEILGKVFSKKSLTEEEKFIISHFKRINPKVVEYLMQKLNNLYIEVLGDDEGSLFQLMIAKNLKGECWQVTESVIVFLNDDDYIERGSFHFDGITPFDNLSSEYYHSWICFNYNGIEYVLDPCLNFLLKKDDYSKMFKTDVKGKVYAKAVKKELMRQITTAKGATDFEENDFIRFMRRNSGDSYDMFMKKKKKEVIVNGTNDVNAPLYRNCSGYKAELEDGKIKKLTVHYYCSDC